MEISQEFAQQLFSYLASKPYAEVFRFIAELERLSQKDGAVPVKQETTAS